MYNWKNSSNRHLKFIGKVTELRRLLVEGFLKERNDMTEPNAPSQVQPRCRGLCDGILIGELQGNLEKQWPRDKRHYA